MIGIIDPPREGMSDVIAKCKGAGIKVLMITGDYALTAAAIASEIGIFTSKNYDTSETVRDKMKSKKIQDEFSNSSSQVTSLLLNGAEIEQLSDENWRTITKYDEIVLARTTPEQKLKTVNEFRKDGYIVAVTGDGVNDAPALKNADIGIAMGSGSEVAIEASQMVLLDNSFTSILIAIENGRLVFDNLRKVILYLLPAGSFAEVVPILVNIFLGVPLPLSAFLMICICILTDMFPALSLMLEKPENNLLKRPPRSKTDHLVDIKLIVQAYLFLGLMEAFFSHCLFFWYLEWYGGFRPSDILFGFDYWNTSYKGYTYEKIQEFIYTGQTITFIGLVIMQAFGNVFATRTSKLSIFQQSPFHKESRNVWILAAQFITIVSMILIVYLPICNSLFNTRPPPIEFWFIPLIFAFIILVADEVRKFFVRNKILCFPKFAW
jgi:sodium/potassium-transporting ATPase subunit alpha